MNTASRNETGRFQRALVAERGNLERGTSQSVGTGEVGDPGGLLYGDDLRDLDGKRETAREDPQEECSKRNLLAGGVDWSKKVCENLTLERRLKR